MIGWFIILLIVCGISLNFFIPLYNYDVIYVVGCLVWFIYNVQIYKLYTAKACYFKRYPYFMLTLLSFVTFLKMITDLSSLDHTNTFTIFTYVYAIFILLFVLSLYRPHIVDKLSYNEKETYLILRSRSGFIHFIASIFLGRGQYNSQAIVSEGYEYSFKPMHIQELNLFWQFIYKTTGYVQTQIVKKKFINNKQNVLIRIQKDKDTLKRLVGKRWSLINNCIFTFNKMSR